METLDYPLATLRSALQGLSHELYFKSTHFRKLGGRVERADHDAAEAFFADSPSVVIGAEVDPFTKLLRDTLVRIAPGLGGDDADELIEKWERAESTLNARVRLIFGLLGERGSAALLQSLVPAIGDLPPLTLFLGRNPVGGKRADGRLGQPDIILQGHGALVSIEMKVRGGSARAMYTADQHLKYLRLANEMRAKEGSGLRTTHILLAPLSQHAIVEGAGIWLKREIRDGVALELDAPGFFSALPPNRAAQLVELGGVSWLDTNQSLMPSRFVDLVRFVRSLYQEAAIDPSVTAELKRQSLTLTQFGVSGAPAREL